MTLDLLKDNIMKKMSEKKQIITMQNRIFYRRAEALFIASLWEFTFLAPFLYGLYWKGVTRAGVWAGFIAGVGITVSNMFIGYIASPINAGAVAMVAKPCDTEIEERRLKAKCLCIAERSHCQCTAHATASADIRLFKSESVPCTGTFSLNKYEISNKK